MSRIMQHQQKWPLLLLALVTSALLITFLQLAEKTPWIADTIGYTHAAEQLAAGKGLGFVDEHNSTVGPYFSMFAYQIRREPGAALYFGFPPGLPLLLAVGALLGRVYLTVPILAAAGVLGTYLLGRVSTGSKWAAFWAALLLAWTPDYWIFGSAAWSEVPSAAFVAVGMACYLLSRRETISQQRALLWSTVSALVITYSFYLRYANVVTVLPALGLYELVTAGKKLLKERWRWYYFVLISGGLVTILIFNHFYYGGAFMTNYSPEHGWYPEPAFSLEYAFGPSFVNGYSFRAVMSALWKNYGLLLALVPIGWLLMERGPRVMSSSAIAATVALYSFYAFAAEDMNSRFLLPAFPFVTVSIGEAVEGVGRHLPGARWRWAGSFLLLAILALPVPGRVEGLRARNAASRNLVAMVEEMTVDFEQEAVFLSYRFNDQIIYYTGRSVLNYRRIPPSDPVEGRYQWELLGPCMNAMVAHLIEQGTPVYYVEDQTPSFGGSLEKLQSQFDLQTVRSNPSVYRLTDDGQKSDIQEETTCPLLVHN